MKEISKLTLDFLRNSYIDGIDIAIVDFKAKKIESNLFINDQCIHGENEKVYFDLASLSKPLTNGIGFLANKEKINEELRLLLNHQAGLPAWGLLSKESWKETILNYPIKKSQTLYSDYSALRFMLEFNKLGMNLHGEASKFWNDDLFFWKDLKKSHNTLQNGFVDKKPNYKFVHDPNAYVIDDLVSHAGLFGTARAVGECLLKLDSELHLLEQMLSGLKESKDRFVNGWDRVQNLDDTFAGRSCSNRTFGHLGFTGTSVWIDINKEVGHILLSNATKFYWYDKREFNIFRKQIGQLVWKNF